MPGHKRPSHAGAAPRRGRVGFSAAWIALAVVLAIATILLLLPRRGLPAEVSVVRAHAMYLDQALLLDVRTQAEYDQQHIPGSQLIPLDELPGRLTELPKDRDIVVVCRSGARSKEGTAILRASGFARSTCMSGGLRAWVAAGYPVEP